jgi:hypothetical protein
MTTESTPTKTPFIETSVLVRILALLLILALTFWACMSVGYRKAEFSSNLSDRYFRMFDRTDIPSRGGMMGMRGPDDLVGGHGTVGKVLSVSLPQVIVSDQDGTERSVRITNETVVRSARSTIASTTIKANDFIVVIGTPDDTGTIEAKLVRIMPLMMNGSSTNPHNQPGMMRNRSY